ncbi:hypothetical protein GCM10009841_34430 [Microlunatus panaciterrae]|uniref:Ferredoxin n=1 Tax=Microlunatus panaciterrae TaxID=400768 RepID=A0ABS2RGH9_9ACTN|nr:ferredoxin [Microlunatus panaciterrae]MBM7798101.1 ferredoxin [Microlunatus panaciterrae]
MSIDLKVDPTACTGHGLCAAWLPEVIDLDEWGYPVLHTSRIRPDLLALARRAAKECPTRALRLMVTPD